MKTIYLLLLLSILSFGCAGPNKIQKNSSLPSSSQPPKAELAEDESALILNAAVKSFPKYLKAKKNKAFAQSEMGVWAWKSDRASRQHAIDTALAQCKQSNKDQEEFFPCKIINVNGIWEAEFNEEQKLTN